MVDGPQKPERLALEFDLTVEAYGNSVVIECSNERDEGGTDSGTAHLYDASEVRKLRDWLNAWLAWADGE